MGSFKKIIIIVVVLLIIGLLVSSCDDSSSGYTDDDVWASYDWGPDHYYNRDTHRVEKNLHGILN